MSDSAILIGHGQDGLTVANRATALAGDAERVQACRPADFLGTLERRAGQVPGNTVIQTVHVVQTDDEEDMRAALAFLPEVARIDAGIAVHVDQWIIAMVGQRWDEAELDILTGADPTRPPYSLMVVSRSNEARALLAPEAELAMAADLAHALSSAPLRQTILSDQTAAQVGAGAAAAYYRREPLIAGILAFHAKKHLLNPILAPWSSERLYAHRAEVWLDEEADGVSALWDELERGSDGPATRDLVAVDPATNVGAPPELLVDTLQTYVDLVVNDRLARAFRSIDEVAARQRARHRDRLYSSAMRVLHDSSSLGATKEFLEYLSAGVGSEAGRMRAASSTVAPAFEPQSLLEDIKNAVAGLPHKPSGMARALGMAGLGLGIGVVLGGFVAPLIALGVGAAAGVGGAGSVMLDLQFKRQAVDSARRRLLERLQQHVSFRLDQHIAEQLWGSLAHLVKLIGRADDLESGCLGGLAKMQASCQEYLEYLDRVAAERFHEEFTPTDLSIFLPTPADSPTEALAEKFPLPGEFGALDALLRGITDGMDKPKAFKPERAFAHYYERGSVNPPQGLWQSLSDLLANSRSSQDSIGRLLSQSTAPLSYPDEDVPQEAVSRFAYLSRDLSEQARRELLEYANETGDALGDDPNSITWVSMRALHDVHARKAGGSRDID